ncbi:uncharacterized protein ARMOST_15470 [Armillaria ostoyae]|uniref:DUF6533 domain-containing protein n=1 Tax=Armillaria ostoyae TaxID=47428 RepID=A0A284RTD1_ARMOS|nr:uncharacterized protein ARMOST_15470 [Armillaria ostoyae]
MDAPVTLLDRLAASLPYADTTLVLWEYLVTFDDEADLFWSSKLSWIKCLFFANRYLIIALRIWDIIATIQIVVMESILVLGVWAIAGRRGFLLWFFFCLLFLNMGATLGILFAAPTMTVTFFIESPSVWMLFDWLPMLLFELIMFMTAAFYGVRGVKSTNILTQVRQNFGPKPIMALLLRDSVFYFLIVLCCFPILAFVDHETGFSLMSITITRMLLRLRKRAKAGLNMPRTQDMELESFRVANPVEVSVASDA